MSEYMYQDLKQFFVEGKHFSSEFLAKFWLKAAAVHCLNYYLH